MKNERKDTTMRLLFAHDICLLRHGNNYYSTGTLSKKVLERYTDVFDEVVVLSRQKRIKDARDSLSLANTERVRFIEVPDFKSIRSLYKMRAAEKIVKREVLHSDTVIARVPSSIGLMAGREAKLTNKLYLVEVVGCAWDSLWTHSWQGKLVAPVDFYQMKQLIKSAPYSIYVTKEFLQKRYPTLGKSISCSDVMLSKQDENIILEREKKIIDKTLDDKFVIGTIGPIDMKYKGQQDIIQALGLLKKRGIENFEYHLVGAGAKNYLADIAKKNKVIDKIKFVGTMPHNQIFDWLSTIDIYAQPSQTEGLPRALIEAMSLGIPSLGSNVGEIPKLLEKEFIFNISNKRIDTITRILCSFDRAKMSEQAKRNYEEVKKYDKEIIDKLRFEFLIRFRDEAQKRNVK